MGRRDSVVDLRHRILAMVSPVEYGVVAVALLLFFFVPGVFVLFESLRNRKAQAVAMHPGTVDVGELLPVPTAPAREMLETVPVPDGAPPVDAAPEAAAAAQEAAVARVEPVEEVSEVAEPQLDEGPYTFRLDDLRRARVLETPPRELLGDPAGQQQWEDGLRLAEKHGSSIGGASLSASFEPQARCFAAIRGLGETTELRFLLFSDLWPTSVDQAAGEAVFEVTGTGVGKAYVVRR